jgi:uncharacterized lipoprotein YddW (UPF0748 family)
MKAGKGTWAWMLILLSGMSLGCGGSAPAPVRDPAQTRGLWITRWDFRTAEDVERCIDDAARLGFTDVYFQVRGQADAFFRSELEPWGQELLVIEAPVSDDDAALPEPVILTDPGYDPLDRAIERARRRGLRLHAWVNVYPLWRGLNPPMASDHLVYRRPEWILHDELGRPQELNDHYVVANPAHPAVQKHLVDVMRDLCARYQLDGLHLDYVRFVSDRLDDRRLWPGDPMSIARWLASGGEGDPSTPTGRAAYRDWLRREITGLVARAAAECREVRPGLEISAAVFRRPELARDSFLQDAAGWLRQGHVDRLMPMIYTRDLSAFQADLAAWRGVAAPQNLTPGIGVYLQEPLELAPQLSASLGNAGWALFAYSSIFESVNPDQDRSVEAVQRRQDIQALLAR